jgi:Uma2 family endonuclease
MGIPRQNPDPMTAEEFFAFTRRVPDEEKSELIEGEPILRPSSSFLHQKIVRNLIVALAKAEENLAASWTATPGIGVQLSTADVPVPDVLVRPRDQLRSWKCNDAVVAEIHWNTGLEPP